MSIAISPPYLLGQAFPLFTLRRTSNLHNSDLDCTSHPLPLFNISSDNFGSLYYNLGPSTQLKPACRLQYVTWTWPRDPASPMPQNMNIAKILNKEKSNKKYLESQCSDQWRKHLELTLSDPPGGRVRAYVHWHLHNKHKRSMASTDERNRCDNKNRALVFGFRNGHIWALSSTFPTHPQLRLFTQQIFLDFRAIFSPMVPHFFGHHDSSNNLAESR